MFVKVFLVKKAPFYLSGARGSVAATAVFCEIARVRISREIFYFDRIVRFNVAENSSTWGKIVPRGRKSTHPVLPTHLPTFGSRVSVIRNINVASPVLCVQYMCGWLLFCITNATHTNRTSYTSTLSCPVRACLRCRSQCALVRYRISSRPSHCHCYQLINTGNYHTITHVCAGRRSHPNFKLKQHKLAQQRGHTDLLYGWISL